MTDKEVLAKYYKEFERNIEAFARFFVPHVLSYEVPKFHKEIYGAVQGLKRLVVSAPRGFAKSTILKIFALHSLLFRTRKDICIVSASEGLAVEHALFIKQELESNQRILRYFGDLRSDKWNERHLVVRHPDGFMSALRAKGAGAQIRGFRPDCLLLDDIETDESVESEEQRKKLKNWLFRACINCLLPGGQLAVFGTPIHPLAVICDLLETPNKWTKLRYKAYKDGVEAKGHELWPEARPHEWLQQRKAEIGSLAFASEYMDDPRTDESSPIKPGQIRYWKELPDQYNSVIAIDPAYSEDAKSDFKVAVHILIDVNHNRYLNTYIRTHEATGDFMDACLNLYLQNKGTITAFGVPASGTEKEFYRSFLNRAQERGINPPFVELTNTFITATGEAVKAKKRRVIAALQPLFESGKYYINESHFEARDELLTIGSSRWDDLVDAMSYAESILTPGYFDMKETQSKQPAMLGRSADYGIEY